MAGDVVGLPQRPFWMRSDVMRQVFRPPPLSPQDEGRLAALHVVQVPGVGQRLFSERLARVADHPLEGRRQLAAVYQRAVQALRKIARRRQVGDAGFVGHADRHFLPQAAADVFQRVEAGKVVKVKAGLGLHGAEHPPAEGGVQ